MPRLSAAAVRATARSLFALLLAIPAVGCAADEPASVLFDPNDHRLSAADKSAIAANFAASYPLSADGKRFEDPGCGDVQPSVEIVDLNEDGQPEVFLQWGNTCSSGMTGRSIALFTRNAEGDFTEHFGFPSAGWRALDGRSQNWPDIEFGGPGFCFGVWHWTDEHYDFKCNLPQEAGGCHEQGNICESQKLK